MSGKPYPAPEVRLPARLTPLRYLLAVLRSRPWLAGSTAVLGALWLVPGALLPLVVGRAIDTGVAGADTAELAWNVGLVVGLGVLQTVFGAGLLFGAHGMWLHAASTTQRLVSHHTLRLGAALRGQADTGDMMAIASSDENRVGAVFEVFGRVLGAVVAFLTVGIVLLGTSPLLAVVALVGVPVAVAGIGPLIAPLQRRQEAQREDLSTVNALAADIVSGLRVLRGVGGERQFANRFAAASQRVRRQGDAVANSTSWLVGAEVLLPGLVTVAITWLGAKLAVAGTITVGELVAFYGASAFLIIPVSTTTEAAGAFSGAMVAARKVCKMLNLRPTLEDAADPVALPSGPLELHDTASGFTAVAGKLTVVESPEAEELAARLARFTDAAEPVLVSGVDVRRAALADLRSRVVYAHNQDVWFSGVLREQIVTPGSVTVAGALTAADADDIVDALPLGLDELIGERGREVSGGQRQRLNLARALALDADVLLLDEPTSAVDAHTEARITERVAELRRGKTTVVFSQSPLWRAVADEYVVKERQPCS
ncbi:ABC transporter transmembrane domain-containing protein [Amycolatopsis albispora]|uniref:ABC transporter transmembrane domain-containing protein n=1 Tax=Amycolatopsis albispora TaxID=1804986 RepID=UPI001F428D2F|nr:ABC transporter ATP-binding protein [Amycolatopsis albispora]